MTDAPLAAWAYEAPLKLSETQFKLSYLRRGLKPPPDPPPQTVEDFARELLGHCVETACHSRPRAVEPKNDKMVKVTKNADNLYHAVAAMRAMRGREDKTRKQLREDAVEFLSKRFPWPGIPESFSEYPQQLETMFEASDKKGMVPGFIAELTAERLRSKETGIVPPPETNFRGYGMPRAMAKMQDERRRHRKPDLVFQSDPSKFLPDEEWDIWRRRQHQLLTKEERARYAGWEQLEYAVIQAATAAMKEARARGQLTEQTPDAKEAALAVFKQWAPLIKTWSEVEVSKAIGVLGSSGNDEDYVSKILQCTIARRSILTPEEAKELEVPDDKEYGGREALFHECFCKQAALPETFATFYELEALAWTLPEKVPIVVYYRQNGKSQPPIVLGPVPLDASKTDARPYELLWSGNDMMLFNPIVPRQVFEGCQEVADRLSNPHTDWLTDDHFKKTDVSRPCYELAKKTMTDGAGGLAPTEKEMAERLEITEEDVDMMERQIVRCGHELFMLADDKRMRGQRTKRRRGECAYKAVSFKMQIIERPDLFHQKPVAKRHRLERTVKDEKLFEDHLRYEGFTADDVYAACKAFKNGTDTRTAMGRWPLPIELAPLLERQPGSMSLRTAGRLFDQAMEEVCTVSHWPLVPDPEGLWWSGGPIEA